MQVLAKPLIIGKQERLILLDGGSQRAAELISLEGRGGSHIEKVWRIQGIVAQELKDGPMQTVCPRLRDNRYLSAGVFSVFRTVGIPQQVKFANRVDSQ